jgi:general secretion pathway protein D
MQIHTGFFSRLIVLVLLLAASACTGRTTYKDPPPPPQPLMMDFAAAAAAQEDPFDEEEERNITPEPLKDTRELPSKRPGKRSGVLTSRKKGASTVLDLDKKEVRQGAINFDKADIREVSKQIFGEYLGVDYILDPNLRGTVSLYFEGEFTEEELIQITTHAFRASGADVVESGGLFIVRPLQRGNTDLEIADSTFIRGSDKDVQPYIVVYRPRFIKAQQAQSLAKFFLTPGRLITFEPMTNSLIFIENQDNARKIVELLKALDVNVFDEMGMEVVALKSLTPDEAVKSLETIMNRMAAFKNSSIMENMAFVPLQKFNGILILSQDNELLQTAKEWLTALDMQGLEVGQQIYVYHVENGLAKDIAEILQQIFDIGGKKSDKSKQIVQATSTPAGQGAPEAPKAPVGAAGATALSTELTGDVAIIPDEKNNIIVIKANASDLSKVKKAVSALDILPRAVLIEVVIAEITLTDSLQYGVEWFLRGRSGDLGGYGIGSGTDSSFGQNFSGGLSDGLSFFLGTNDFQSFLQMVETEGKVNILSTPTLLALDNTEATITVGGREPTITRSSTQTTDSDAPIVNDIQYEDTGIILDVTPHINSSGLVRLEISQQIIDINDTPLTGIDGLNTPRFTERNIKTSLVAEDGKTVVIGGIIETSNNNNRQGIPILGDIPLLGFFFSRTEIDVEKTELIVAITPHVVKRTKDPVTDEFIRRLNSIRARISDVGG